MPESVVSPNQTPQAEETEQEVAQNSKEYGCIFCITGREFAVTQRLEKAIPGLKAISPVKLRYRRIDGVAHEERVILFPGYVFFEVQSGSNVDIRTIYIDQDVLKVLYVDEEKKDWRLVDPDRSIVRRFFTMKGLVGLSEVEFDLTGKLHALRGFLYGNDEEVKAVNKRAKTAKIVLQIGDTRKGFWVGFTSSIIDNKSITE